MELLIKNGLKAYIPIVQDGIEWSTERYGTPGKLTFKVIQDDLLNITEGNVVRLKKDNKNSKKNYKRNYFKIMKLI